MSNLERALRIRLQWTDEHLLEEFWEEFDSDPMGFRPPPPKEIWEMFKTWAEPHRDAICSSERVRDAAESGDEYQIAAAIADIVGAAGIASATVLVSRYGVKKLCADLWATSDLESSKDEEK